MAADSASSAAIQTFPKEGTVEHFVEEFMLKNLPCLFDASFTHEWPSRQLWVNTQGQPNLEYLNQEYGTTHLSEKLMEESHFVYCINLYVCH